MRFSPLPQVVPNGRLVQALALMHRKRAISSGVFCKSSFSTRNWIPWWEGLGLSAGMLRKTPLETLASKPTPILNRAGPEFHFQALPRPLNTPPLPQPRLCIYCCLCLAW